MSTTYQIVASDVAALCALAASPAPPGVRLDLRRITTSRDQQLVAVAQLKVGRGVTPTLVTEWLALGLSESDGSLLVDGVPVRLPSPVAAARRRASAHRPLVTRLHGCAR